MDLPVPPVHPEEIEQVHPEGQVQEMLLRMRQLSCPVERESSLNPGERERNFCTMVYFWKDEMKVWKKK
jgi:hypothetical protein